MDERGAASPVWAAAFVADPVARNLARMPLVNGHALCLFYLLPPVVELLNITKLLPAVAFAQQFCELFERRPIERAARHVA